MNFNQSPFLQHECKHRRDDKEKIRENSWSFEDISKRIFKYLYRQWEKWLSTLDKLILNSIFFSWTFCTIHLSFFSSNSERKIGKIKLARSPIKKNFSQLIAFIARERVASVFSPNGSKLVHVMDMNIWKIVCYEDGDLREASEERRVGFIDEVRILRDRSKLPWSIIRGMTRLARH